MTSFGYDILGFGVSGGGPVTLTSTALINSLSNRSNVTTSSFILPSGTLIIPADFWLWASSTGTAALIVDTPNATIENSGYIVGKGGASSAGAGGDAISITASGVTIINSSGAYIAGGGGAGRNSNRNSTAGHGAGGGGQSGTPTLGAAGANGNNSGSSGGGSGGGAGGGGASLTFAGGATGGQGGYILPGSGGAGGTTSGYRSGGAGGSANNVGGNGTNAGYDSVGSLDSSGGGGGWGANGGTNGVGTAGGAGGKGIEANSNSFTLTNNGTIYGSQS